MKTVLVTCSSGAGSYSIRKGLSGKYRLIGVDSNGLSDGLYREENNSYYVVKNGDSEGYIDDIIEICKKEHVDVIWPTSDEEVVAISNNREITRLFIFIGFKR